MITEKQLLLFFTKKQKIFGNGTTINVFLFTKTVFTFLMEFKLKEIQKEEI